MYHLAPARIACLCLRLHLEMAGGIVPLTAAKIHCCTFCNEKAAVPKKSHRAERLGIMKEPDRVLVV